MTVQTLRSIGMNVDAQTMDWAAHRGAPRQERCARGRRLERLRHRRRRVRRQFADHQRLPQPRLRQQPARLALRQAARRTAHRLDQETVPAKRKELLDSFQTRAYEAVPVRTSASTRRLSPRAPVLKGLDKCGPACRRSGRSTSRRATRALGMGSFAVASPPRCRDGGGGGDRLPADPPVARATRRR